MHPAPEPPGSGTNGSWMIQNVRQQPNFGNCYAMLSGLLYENIVQKSKLEEFQRREDKRKHEDAKSDFQKQMISMMQDFK
jgi:hypothetical protein